MREIDLPKHLQAWLHHDITLSDIRLDVCMVHGDFDLLAFQCFPDVAATRQVVVLNTTMQDYGDTECQRKIMISCVLRVTEHNELTLEIDIADLQTGGVGATRTPAPRESAHKL